MMLFQRSKGSLLFVALLLFVAMAVAVEQEAVIDESGEVTMKTKVEEREMEDGLDDDTMSPKMQTKQDDDEEEEEDEEDEDYEEEEEDPVYGRVEDGYYQYTDVKDFPYYPEEFEGNGRPARMCGDPGVSNKGCIYPEMFIMSDFVVAGINLASWRVLHPKFELFEDFNIGPLITGNEGWKDLLRIRNKLERPSLTWYVDKVARKRWLKEKRYPQPEVYYIKYKHELSSTGKKEDEVVAIADNLPTEHGFCAKPTHMSMTMGNWLVDLDPNNQEEVKFTKFARKLTSDEPYNPNECADALAEGLQRKAASIESWALKQVEPGLVVEELWSSHEDRSLPPHEFCLFVVWGRVYVGVWNEVSSDRYLDGFIYRDGTAAPGCPFYGELPEWIPWKEMVDIAESLGANKDMFRVDMFVGVPRYSSQEDTNELRIAVSESEIHPTTIFCNPFIADEMARLWVSGYKTGNYQVVPNTEVPASYMEYLANRNVTSESK